MRFNYLQNGGHDQYLLNRFNDMEYEARVKESNKFRPAHLSNLINLSFTQCYFNIYLFNLINVIMFENLQLSNY